MYMKQMFTETRPEVLRAMVREYPFATLIVPTGQDVLADHLPMELVEDTGGGFGLLRGHLARGNPLWKEIGAGRPALAIIQGPHGYITPNWYPSKHRTGEALPTWNYTAVHLRGTLRAIEDEAWLRGHIGRLSDHMERGQAHPWRVEDAPEAFTAKMVRGIVGLELRVEQVDGKRKTSQNRPPEDRAGVVAGLRASAAMPPMPTPWRDWWKR